MSGGSMPDSPLIAGLGRYDSLTKAIIPSTMNWLPIETSTFGDGERYHRLNADVKGRDVVLVCGTIDDQHTMDLYDVSCAVTKYGARSLMMVIPYFGYCTMERAVKPGEIVKAKTRARLLSSIPQGSKPNTVLLLDLHAAGIPHYFEDSIKVHHIYAENEVLLAIRKLIGERGDIVIGSTDAGERAKWVESLAKKLCLPSSICSKQRDKEIVTLKAAPTDVDGKHVIIYDDIFRSCTSLSQAARAFRAAGAISVDAVATHGLSTFDQLKKLIQQNMVSRMMTSDSHPNHRDGYLLMDQYENFSIAPLLRDKIQYYL